MARHVYSDEQKAALVAMFAASDVSEAEFCRRKKVARTTFREWLAADDDAKRLIRQREKRRLTDLYREEIEASLAAAGAKRDDASYRDLMVGVGILDDKVTRASGEPTSRIAVDDARQAAAEAGIEPADILAEVEAMMRERGEE